MYHIGSEVAFRYHIESEFALCTILNVGLILYFILTMRFICVSY